MDKTDIIIAFDLHSVVLKPDIKEIMHTLWHWPHKLAIFACMFNIKLFYKSCKLLFDDPTDEEYFALFEKYCPKIEPFIIELLNAFKPIGDMVTLLKELKSKGYELHILSNIGPRRFKALQTRHPELMALFEHAQITNGNVKNLIKKPNPMFFQEYLDTYNPDHKRVIFIDDKSRNITQANASGLQGILFKSASQLRIALQQLHIL